ncbi:hypothetical protein [Deinococcus humi]|uniref:Uncharacterized protein n=1 Tax=Deinococcus humi TaxID=662880 RepID=A0A7W8JWN2_9DEIO|nr:hypothetical protein [Deinococcus humi]MBB5364504.1 hypothetical protein [Deinococcus humi]GGO37955.1 hypothetical protein GCM10008949_43840 [Deinococcus humi]
MKKIILATFLILANPAHSINLDSSNIDCGTFKVDNTLNRVIMTWKTYASFPNNPQLKLVQGLMPDDYLVKCPGISVSIKNGIWNISFDNRKEMQKVFPKFYIAFDYGYQYPETKQGISVGSLDFSYDGVVKLDQKVVLPDEAVNSMISSQVSGYKVNNGPLTPVLYNGKYLGLDLDLNGIVEIWTKQWSSTDLINYQKIDFSKNTYENRIVREFPAN